MTVGHTCFSTSSRGYNKHRDLYLLNLGSCKDSVLTGPAVQMYDPMARSLALENGRHSDDYLAGDMKTHHSSLSKQSALSRSLSSEVSRVFGRQPSEASRATTVP